MSPKIRWAHACNSLQSLQSAIALGVEAIEVVLAFNVVHNVAVLKHASQSHEKDLAQECLAKDWIELAYKEENRRFQILKFDFKNIQAVPELIDLLVSRQTETSPTVFLNADIVSGPGRDDEGRQAPVDAHEFLEYCARLPSATLSLGWTTAYSPFKTIRYERKHIRAMLEVLENTKNKKITFPIRASLAFDSWAALCHLLQHSADYSLTLWTADEGVPETDLLWMISALRESQIYVDCDKGPKLPHWHPLRLLYFKW